MPKILLIYNPIAGKNINRMEMIHNLIIEASKYYMVCVFRLSADHDLEKVLQNESEWEYVVCCGGDGTLHHLTNLMMQMDINIPIAYIPIGSTNDNAKSLGLTRKNAISVALSKHTQRIDVGKFNDQYFNYVAAFGIFTDVSYKTPQSLKNTLGYLAYLLEGIRQVGNLNGINLAIKTDNIIYQDDFLVGIISNSLSVAGMKQLNVDANNLSDGMMDYVFIKKPQNILEIQGIISELLSGKCNHKYMYTGKSCSFEFSSEAMAWTLDGEYGGLHNQVNIHTIPSRLEIKVGYEDERFLK